MDDEDATTLQGQGSQTESDDGEPLTWGSGPESELRGVVHAMEKKQGAQAPPSGAREPSTLYTMLHPKSKGVLARSFRRFIALIIVLDVVLIYAATVPSFLSNPAARRWLQWLELVTMTVFLAEYLMRVCVITESSQYAEPIRGRLRYLRSWDGLLDGFAISSSLLPHLPRLRDSAGFMLSALGETVASKMGPDFGEGVVALASLLYVPDVIADQIVALPPNPILAVCTEAVRGSFSIAGAFGGKLPRTSFLRVLRLSRLLRTERYARAVEITHRILWFNREILTAALVICTVLVLFTSALLYYLPPLNSADFESLPATTYLAILLLTGQGLGVDTPLPWETKLVIVITSIFSVAMFAIPASMITWGFEAEAARLAKRQARRRLKKKRRGLRAEPKSIWSDSSSDDPQNWRPVFDQDHRAWRESQAPATPLRASEALRAPPLRHHLFPLFFLLESWCRQRLFFNRGAAADFFR